MTTEHEPNLSEINSVNIGYDGGEPSAEFFEKNKKIRLT